VVNAGGQCSSERQHARREAAAGAEANITGFIFLENGNHVVVLGWWNGIREVLIERADGSRVVRPFRGLRKPPEDPYRAALEAELRADLLRAQAGLPAATTFAKADGEGLVRRGPKARHPERAAFLTFLDIDQLGRISLVLARGGLSPEERELILASLPAELRENFRSIVGRHRRYGRRRKLSREAVKELVKGVDYLRNLLKRKPDSDAWARGEWEVRDHVVELSLAAFGPSIAGKINSDRLATRDHVLEGPVAPGYVRGIPRRLDEWGAARLETTLATFRSWRTKLRKDGFLCTPPPRGQAKRVRDN
jgi:hypothetical protein